MGQLYDRVSEPRQWQYKTSRDSFARRQRLQIHQEVELGEQSDSFNQGGFGGSRSSIEGKESGRQYGLWKCT